MLLELSVPKTLVSFIMTSRLPKRYDTFTLDFIAHKQMLLELFFTKIKNEYMVRRQTSRKTSLETVDKA